MRVRKGWRWKKNGQRGRVGSCVSKTWQGRRFDGYLVKKQDKFSRKAVYFSQLESRHAGELQDEGAPAGQEEEDKLEEVSR